MEGGLTTEQEFLLCQMKGDLERMNKAQLIDLAVAAQARIFALAHQFEAVVVEAGIAGQVQFFDSGPMIPASEEELVAAFGRVPSNQEVAQLVQEKIEAFERFHGMDIDIADIAMEEDL